MSKITVTINGKAYLTEPDKTILQVATENKIYIPTLCFLEGIKAQGSCRICTCMVNGKMMTACTTPVNDGMEVVTNTEELEKLRSKIVELLFAEGNHFCPSCERSGNCELQALAYRYKIMVPEFDYIYPARDVDAIHPKLIIDHNRCILCKRCIRRKKEPENPTWFVFENRGNKVKINFDKEHTADMDDEMAQKAMDTCPVGAIIHKEKGYDVPIGRRKYDKNPIGSDIEGKE
ncbi:MAG: (2Fe-2S)-binding protein [Candidatus Cloacimonetes bacterium]|nr:(2Fe-2S)-binding protein [Candidatus Cloacimonadota bacterium]MCF7814532.1 (2Fe-2S)-binding protein [Candidatus Cloacimonadota bacterium]MCF7867676.1 (2Fe-2S)-binding protein [Candidatus Cloacimonadota bacterium]MCF7883526.1 (2Fe-2S)-binding protein [Candidatus Cloacimonadota bacterium]